LSSTDTNITGNVRCGLHTFQNVAHSFGDFEAADLSAATITGPLVGAGHLFGNGPLVRGRLVRS
jgi:hypothetical protein